MGVILCCCCGCVRVFVCVCFFCFCCKCFYFAVGRGGVLSKRKTPHPHQQQKNTASHANSKTDHPPAATAKSTLTWIFEPIPLNRHYKCIEQELSFIVEIRCLCPLQCPLPDSCRPGYTGIPKHTPYKALHAAKLESACIKKVSHHSCIAGEGRGKTKSMPHMPRGDRASGTPQLGHAFVAEVCCRFLRNTPCHVT